VVYNLDLELERLEKFKPIFLIEKYFNLLEKANKVIVVPFIVAPRKLDYNCPHLFENKKSHNLFYYCNHDEWVSNYILKGSLLISCENCPKNTLNKKK